MSTSTATTTTSYTKMIPLEIRVDANLAEIDAGKSPLLSEAYYAKPISAVDGAKFVATCKDCMAGACGSLKLSPGQVVIAAWYYDNKQSPKNASKSKASPILPSAYVKTPKPQVTVAVFTPAMKAKAKAIDAAKSAVSTKPDDEYFQKPIDMVNAGSWQACSCLAGPCCGMSCGQIALAVWAWEAKNSGKASKPNMTCVNDKGVIEGFNPNRPLVPGGRKIISTYSPATDQTPWALRGEPIHPKEVIGRKRNKPMQLWNLFATPKMVPTMAAADYYILTPLRDRVFWKPKATTLSFYETEAAELLKVMVEVWDPIFCRYMDMAVGGELRHMGDTVRPVLVGARRDLAWAGWKVVRDKLGIQAICDAGVLFRAHGRGSYGGRKWALIAEALYARMSDAITPELWLDRVFNLQHNGGVALNKVDWRGDINLIITHAGPAHAADPTDIRILAQFASRPVQNLWSKYHQELTELRREYAMGEAGYYYKFTTLSAYDTGYATHKLIQEIPRDLDYRKICKGAW